MEAGAFEAIVLEIKQSGSGVENALSDGRNYTYPGDFGSHISLLGMGLYNLLKKIGLVSGRQVAGAGDHASVWMMTGGTVSTMRAVCMFLLSVGAKIAGRIYDMPTGWRLRRS